jgi:hypothetical protein
MRARRSAKVGNRGGLVNNQYPHPLPLGSNEIIGLAESFALVFDSKQVISKYSGIRTYGISTVCSAFLTPEVGDLLRFKFSKNSAMVLERRGVIVDCDRHTLRCSNQETSFTQVLVEVCDGAHNAFVTNQ